MVVIGSRKRKVRRKDGTTIILIIRRLYCKHCRHIHHELPDFIVPRKRYSSDAIETALKASRTDRQDDIFPGETSTMARLKIWFSLLKKYIEAVLQSMKTLYSDDGELAEEVDNLLPLDPLHDPPGWLKKIVRILINSGRWVQTRSAMIVRS